MGKVKIGVFGAARGMTLIRQFLGDEEAELVAVCDKYEPLLEKTKKVAEECGAKVALYSNYEDFFQHDMDAVFLANYAHEHAKYAIPLLESGRDVMSEVLTCANMSEAVRLIEAVEKSGRLYAYAENYCYFNTSYEMKVRYQRGDIGELMHAEGEYVHDCSAWWPHITYGERDHWRNRENSTFYCTHSLGPIVYATGLRPVKVIGMETRSMPYMQQFGYPAPAAGLELIELENHAMVKSLHGNLKREPMSINYQMYGSKGMMETDRFTEGELHVYREGDTLGQGEWEKYSPAFAVKGAENCGHNGSDFFSAYYFTRALLGDEESKSRLIDVYSAVDMCLPGIQAYRSIVNGNTPQVVPNFRNLDEREQWRNDTFCGWKEVAGDQFAPINTQENIEIPDEAYERARAIWQEWEKNQK